MMMCGRYPKPKPNPNPNPKPKPKLNQGDEEWLKKVVEKLEDLLNLTGDPLTEKNPDVIALPTLDEYKRDGIFMNLVAVFTINLHNF
jgi:hypothetical protein